MREAGCLIYMPMYQVQLVQQSFVLRLLSVLPEEQKQHFSPLILERLTTQLARSTSLQLLNEFSLVTLQIDSVRECM